MTYLEAVNSVLIRMREDSVITLAGSDDVVVDLVKRYINDAVRTVSEAHTWSALAETWTVDTAADVKQVALVGPSVINAVYSPEGQPLRFASRTELVRRGLSAPAANNPRYFAVDGAGQLMLWPTPNAIKTYTVVGTATHATLDTDDDVILVPSLPVEHLALAFAARERGEVGAQSVPELLGIAGQSLTDAIALDASNTPSDNIWTSV